MSGRILTGGDTAGTFGESLGLNENDITVNSENELEFARETIEGGSDIIWNAQTVLAPRPDNQWLSVINGKGLFAVGGVQCIITSPDSDDWTLHETPDAIVHTAGYHDGDQFIFGGLVHVTTSPNGDNWTQPGYPSGGVQGEFRSITQGNEVYVAISSQGGSIISTSTDLINWTRKLLPPVKLNAVRFLNGVHIAVGDGQILTSINGDDWDTQVLPGSWNDICYYGKLYILVGDGQIATSNDRTNWTVTPLSGNWKTVTCGELIVAIANNDVGNDTIAVSKNGKDWDLSEAPVRGINQITQSNDCYVAVGGQWVMTGKRSASVLKSVTGDNIRYDGAKTVNEKIGKLDAGLAQANTDISGKLDKSGGTITGNLEVNGDTAIHGGLAVDGTITKGGESVATTGDLEAKQDKVSTAVNDNIATWGSGSTKDSGMAFTTIVGSQSTDKEVPNAKVIYESIESAKLGNPDFQGRFDYFGFKDDVDAIENPVTTEFNGIPIAIAYTGDLYNVQAVWRGDFESGAWIWSAASPTPASGMWIWATYLLNHPKGNTFARGQVVYKDDGVNDPKFDELLATDFVPDEITLGIKGDGSIEVKPSFIDSEPVENSKNLVESGGVWSWFGGALSTLKTTAKNIIGAINELFDNKQDKTKIVTLSGTSPTLVADAHSILVPTGATTINLPAVDSNSVHFCDLEINMGATAYIVNLPNTIKWTGGIGFDGNDPNTTYFIPLRTRNGVTWFGGWDFVE